MKKLLLLVPLLSFAQIEYKGNVGLKSAFYEQKDSKKRDSNLALTFDIELKKRFDNGQFLFNAKSIYDKDDQNRRFTNIKDFSYTHNYDDSDLNIGIQSLFWGSLEFFNITDVYNTKNILDDPFNYDSKIGALGLNYTYYFQNSELSILAKFKEDDQEVQDNKSINNFYPPNYNTHLLTQKENHRPSVFIKYSGSSEDIQLDYSFIYENGYDNNRYISIGNNVSHQNAFLVNKFLFYSTLIVDNTIYKSEFSLTQSRSKAVSDYEHIAFGFEHTLVAIWDKKDLGLLVEYYHYNAQENNKQNLAILYNDDLNIGFRLNINDQASSELLAGVDIDRDNQEKIYFLSVNTRILEQYKLKLSYQHLSPTQSSVFKKLDLFSIEFNYYF
jgi:hypothetical protein